VKATRLRRIGDGLAGLAGARSEILELAPGARSKFVALGGVLLSTGALAVLSMSFAVHMALGVWWPLAMLVGLGWGFVVVNLDRMLLVGMAHDSSLKRNIVLAVPRVGLALVLGVVIATPLTLQVFHKEIDTQIVALQAEKSDAYQRSLDADARFAGLPELRQTVALEQEIVASGGLADPGLAVVHGEVTARQAAYDDAMATRRDLEARAQCELDGSCGTGDAGTGTAYQEARAAADAQAAVVTTTRSDLESALDAASAAQDRSAQQARVDLETHQAELTRLTEQRTELQAAFDATNSDSGGLLLRLEALSRLGDTNATLWAAQVMLSLLFMSIEVLPVLMKLLLNFSPPTAYDQLAALRDRGDLDAEEIKLQARRTVEEAEAELLVLAEKERVDRQRDQVLARRRARLAAQQVVPSSPEVQQAEEQEAETLGRALWDTGPIRLARSVAGRSVRSVRRRPAVPTAS
jgi:Domain of unknown function (DUF4407)